LYRVLETADWLSTIDLRHQEINRMVGELRVVLIDGSSRVSIVPVIVLRNATEWEICKE